MLEGINEVSVVGCGGIGTWLIPPLARFLAAEKFQGRLCLWDGDSFSDSNASRQDMQFDQIGRPKAECMADRLRASLGALVDVTAYSEYVTPLNVANCLKENSLVIAAVDNHPVRALLTRAAIETRDCALLCAGNEKLDGNVHVFVRKAGKSLNPDMISTHPEVGTAKSGERSPGCVELISQGDTQLLVTNFAAATCVLMAFFSLWENGTRFGRVKLTRIPNEIYFDVGQCLVSPHWRGDA